MCPWCQKVTLLLITAKYTGPSTIKLPNRFVYFISVLEIEKKQITTSLQSLEEENLKLRSQINELKKDYETSKRKENQFNEKIDELNQETDNLLEEIDKWQM